MENLEQIFFSKNNIGIINNKLLNQFNIKNDKDKKYVSSILMKNIKNTWSSLDKSKINKNNFNSIYGQFNNIILNTTVSELNTALNGKKTYDPNTLKFERDFKSNPNNGVNYLERSQPVLKNNNNSILGPNQEFMLKSNENKKYANNFDSSLDTLFRPLINEPSELNTYQTNKNNTNDFKERLQEIQQIRNNDVPLPKTANELPDFLKSKPTSVRSDQDVINKEKTNNELQFLDSNDDDNLFSLDNIDKPLILTEIEEDTAPFSDRLKRLQDERNNISLPVQKTVNFTSETFEDTFESLKDIKPTIINNKEPVNRGQYNEPVNQRQNNVDQRQYNEPVNQRQYDEPVNRGQYNEPVNRGQYNESVNRGQNNIEQRQYNEPVNRGQYDELVNRGQNNEPVNQKEYVEYNKNIEFEKFLKQKEIEKKISKKNESKTEKSSYKEIFDQLKNFNSNLLNQINKLKLELDEIKNDKTTQFDSIKQDIIIEFEKLNEIKVINERKENELNMKEFDIDKKINELNMKEFDIDKKINELKIKEHEIENRENEYIRLYNQYSSLINIKNYQLEISPDISISNYKYNLSKSIIVSSIKLINYSIPQCKFNIEENINNIFNFIIIETNETKEIILPTGYYDIDILIEKLNNNEHYIIFELDKLQQNILINAEFQIQLVNTNLSYNVLGFTNYDNVNNNFIADNIYDLRIDNKIYLFLENISLQPFAILNFNNTINDSEIKFENDILLEYLDISFKNSKGININFYNNKHYLNLQLTSNN